LETGIKNTWHLFTDQKQKAFHYMQGILAGYGQFSYSKSKQKQGLDLQAGSRVEQSRSHLRTKLTMAFKCRVP